MLVGSQLRQRHNLYAPQNWPIFKLWPQMRLMGLVGYRMKNACVFFTIFIINSLLVMALALKNYCKCKGLIDFNYSLFPSQLEVLTPL